MYAAALVAVFLYKEPLIEWIGRGEKDMAEIPPLLLISTLLGLFPVIPFGVFAGAMGAKFGMATGMAISMFGSVAAALLTFGLVRTMFREQGRAFLARFRGIDKLTLLIERTPFYAITVARMIPIMPAQVVNVYAALSRVRFGTFTAATCIGKLPMMLIYVFVGNQIFQSPGKTAAAIAIYAVFLSLVYLGYKSRMKRHAE